MFRLFIPILIAGLLLSCTKNSTENKEESNNKSSFKSVNVKTDGTQYFIFSTNQGTLRAPAQYDIAFGLVPLTIEVATCQYFTMSNDPVVLTGPDITMAKIAAASLDEVTVIPDSAAFTADDARGNAFIGKAWFDAQYNVKPDVYVVKTCAGNFGLLDIKRYEMDFTKMQIKNIVWEFRYNNNGSADFSAAATDSFATGNAYDETRYYSFAAGAVTTDDSYDLKVIGSLIWLGNNVSVKKMENSSLTAITAVTDTGFEADVLPSYVTRDWYIYGDQHLLTPDDFVYVVKTSDGKYPAFEITNYYKDQGNSGMFTIEWKYLN
jgi:hypothetical protein